MSLDCGSRFKLLEFDDRIWCVDGVEEFGRKIKRCHGTCVTELGEEIDL